MKFIIDKMPTEPRECVFSGTKVVEHKEPRTGTFKHFLKPKTIPTFHYGCWIDKDFCELRSNGTCSKLKVLNK